MTTETFRQHHYIDNYNAKKGRIFPCKFPIWVVIFTSFSSIESLSIRNVRFYLR